MNHMLMPLPAPATVIAQTTAPWTDAFKALVRSLVEITETWFQNRFTRGAANWYNAANNSIQ